MSLQTVISTIADTVKTDLPTLAITIGSPQFSPPAAYPQFEIYGANTVYGSGRAIHRILCGVAVQTAELVVDDTVSLYSGFFEVLTLANAIKLSIAKSAKLISLDINDETLDALEHNNVYSVKFAITCHEVIPSKGY